VAASVIVEHGRVQAGSILQYGSASHALPAGGWFGEPCLRGPGIPVLAAFAALGDPGQWCGQ
jgi:hypothetical protein